MQRGAQRSLTGVLGVIGLAGILVGCGQSSIETAGLTVPGDPVRGKELYEQCAACHHLTQNSVGPMHCGLFGRKAGTVATFDYSEAMRDSGIVWDVETLDGFLTMPFSYVSGTRMGFAGFSSATDRQDVIAYLHQANNDPTVCPKG